MSFFIKTMPKKIMDFEHPTARGIPFGMWRS